MVQTELVVQSIIEAELYLLRSERSTVPSLVWDSGVHQMNDSVLCFTAKLPLHIVLPVLAVSLAIDRLCQDWIELLTDKDLRVTQEHTGLVPLNILQWQFSQLCNCKDPNHRLGVDVIHWSTLSLTNFGNNFLKIILERPGQVMWSCGTCCFRKQGSRLIPSDYWQANRTRVKKDGCAS